MTEPEKQSSDFTSEADQPQPGLLREFWDFLRYYKKWWLAPILIVLLLLGLLVVLSSSPATSFIYPF